MKDGDKVCLSEDIKVEVIGTPGHSADEVSYRIGDMVFIGDAVPVKGDIPIFIDVEKTKNTLKILGNLRDVKTFYPAWDQIYSLEEMKRKIMDANANAEDKSIICKNRGMLQEGSINATIFNRKSQKLYTSVG